MPEEQTVPPISQYGIAWKRIGRAFPELQMWPVDTDKAAHAKTTWSEWLKE